MLKQHVHPKIVSERLGHSSIGITLDTYSHVMPGLQEAAALQFDESMQQDSELSTSEMLAIG
jgi:integrase